MHELSLATSLFSLIENECSRINRWDLKEVEIEIGEMAGVEMQSFKFCLENIKKGSRFKDLEFVYIIIDGKARCIDCGEEFYTNQHFPQCPKCKSSITGLISGKEFKVKSLIF